MTQWTLHGNYPSVLGTDRFRYLVDHAVRDKIANDEAEIRHMLSRWVSELEPCIVYMRNRLVGLGPNTGEIGEQAQITIRAWER